MTMRVLHLVANLGAGGAEKQLYLLCRHTRQKVQHTVLALSGGGRWVEPIRELGVEVNRLDHSCLRSPSLLWRTRAALIQMEQPSLVHCWLPSINLLGALAVRLTPGWQCPVIASVHNVDEWKPSWYRFLDRLVCPLWDSVISNCHAGVRLTRSSGVAADRIFVVPNGIESRPMPSRAEIAQARLDYGLPPEAFVLCSASRLVPQKRVDRIVRIAAELGRTSPRIRFLIAGDGPDRSALESMIVSLGLGEQVKLLGSLPDTRPVLAASQLFLLCSVREGLPNGLMEAMQTGCVPLVTDTGDNRHLLSQVNPNLVMPHEKMPEAILHFFSNPERLRPIRRKAREVIDSFSVPSMATKTLNVYRTVLSANHFEPAYEPF
jgi:glycosyltransferase involved in cell wall biosynthesis